MKKTFVFILFLVAGVNLMAQSYGTNNKKAIRYFEQGRVALNQGDKMKAVENFWLSLKADPNFIELYLSIGDIEMGDRNYSEARRCYETFLSRDKSHLQWQQMAKDALKVIEYREHAIANPVPFNPENMGPNINSRDDEYLPALTVDGRTLIFTRRFPRNARTMHNAPKEEDFYISTLGDDGKWSLAKRMSEPVNSHDNEGAQCISQDGRIMFFTACGRADGGGGCDLYMCTRKGDKWSKPRNLGPVVNSNKWESQPSFSIDGRTLYFASNRPGGYGGMDIYKTVYKGGAWSAPENLGPTINTEKNDMAPFIHYNNRTLYFSSDGHQGMGGMDLFMSEMDDNGQWSTPVNLGYPINTEGDESTLIVAADGHTAILSSDRLRGYGNVDLYTFQLPEAVQAVAVAYQKGVTYDKKTNEKVSAQVSIINVETGEEVANTTSDGSNGVFMVSLPSQATYALHVSAKGYLFYSANFDFRQGLSGASTDVLQVPLSPIEVGEEITLRNIFFNTASYELLPTSHAELRTVVDLLNNNPTIHIQLSGHTDNVGNDQYNQQLSTNRAKAVYEYLIKAGIDATRLSYKGYGSSRPVSSNDNEDGRAQNRRTTLKIVQ